MKEYVWYSPAVDEFFTLKVKPEKGFENDEHTLMLQATPILYYCYYIGEL